MEFIKVATNVYDEVPKEKQLLEMPECNGGNAYRILNTKKPFTCPVCMGRGFVSGGFYSSTGNSWVTTTTAPDTCRSCNGTGVVWSD